MKDHGHVQLSLFGYDDPMVGKIFVRSDDGFQIQIIGRHQKPPSKKLVNIWKRYKKRYLPGNDVVYDCMAWNGRWVPYLLTVSLWDIGQDYEEKSDKHNEITARWDAISKEMTSNNKEEIKNDSNH